MFARAASQARWITTGIQHNKHALDAERAVIREPLLVLQTKGGWLRYLQLLECESTAQTLFPVVLDCLCMDNWAEGPCRRPGERLSGLDSARCKRTTKLTARKELTGAKIYHECIAVTHRASRVPSRLRTFRAGWLNHVLTINCHFFLKCWCGISLLCFGIVSKRSPPAQREFFSYLHQSKSGGDTECEDTHLPNQRTRKRQPVVFKRNIRE